MNPLTLTLLNRSTIQFFLPLTHLLLETIIYLYGEKQNREEHDYGAHATKTFSVCKLSCTTKITMMMIMTLLWLLLFQLLPFACWIDSFGENLRKYDYCNACTFFGFVLVWCARVFVFFFGREQKNVSTSFEGP